MRNFLLILFQGFEQQRNFFDEFAKSKQFNPLDAAKWYSITCKEIETTKGGRGVLKYFKGSHIRALITLYPELMLKEEDFLHSQVWKTPEMRRKFLDEFAKFKQFDPLDATKWYSISNREITRVGGTSILNYYKGSHITAVMRLYPELMLNKENFLQFQGRRSEKTRKLPVNLQNLN